MKTADFGFGGGEFFFGREFGSRAVTEANGREDAIRRAQALWPTACATPAAAA